MRQDRGPWIAIAGRSSIHQYEVHAVVPSQLLTAHSLFQPEAANRKPNRQIKIGPVWSCKVQSQWRESMQPPQMASATSLAAAAFAVLLSVATAQVVVTLPWTTGQGSGSLPMSCGDSLVFTWTGSHGVSELTAGARPTKRFALSDCGCPHIAEISPRPLHRGLHPPHTSPCKPLPLPPKHCATPPHPTPHPTPPHHTDIPATLSTTTPATLATTIHHHATTHSVSCTCAQCSTSSPAPSYTPPSLPAPPPCAQRTAPSLARCLRPSQLGAATQSPSAHLAPPTTRLQVCVWWGGPRQL